jgi:hypothetical protein
MSYIETARRIRVEIKKKREESKSSLHNFSISAKDGLNSKPSYEKNEFNEINPIYLEEATRLFQKRGWVKIWSGYLKQSIYLVKDKKIIVPDLTLSRYTQDEIESLKGLSWEETQTLHKAKVLFKGEIL